MRHFAPLPEEALHRHPALGSVPVKAEGEYSNLGRPKDGPGLNTHYTKFSPEGEGRGATLTLRGKLCRSPRGSDGDTTHPRWCSPSLSRGRFMKGPHPRAPHEPACSAGPRGDTPRTPIISPERKEAVSCPA